MKRILYKHINTNDILGEDRLSEIPKIGDIITIYSTDYVVRDIVDTDDIDNRIEIYVELRTE